MGIGQLPQKCHEMGFHSGIAERIARLFFCFFIADQTVGVPSLLTLFELTIRLRTKE